MSDKSNVLDIFTGGEYIERVYIPDRGDFFAHPGLNFLTVPLNDQPKEAVVIPFQNSIEMKKGEF